MKLEIKVSYIGNIDIELDRNIRAFFEEHGCKLNTSGVEIDTGKRDVCFDTHSNIILTGLAQGINFRELAREITAWAGGLDGQA